VQDKIKPISEFFCYNHFVGFYLVKISVNVT